MRERVRRIKDGFQPQVLKCMAENRSQAVFAVREQLYSGIDGEDKPLEPNYMNDPWFEHHRAGYYDEESEQWVSCFMHPERYVEWKERITPPQPSDALGLPARDKDTPNLFIIGTFHGSISSNPTPKGIEIFTKGWDEGPAVEAKYGSQIFGLGTAGTGYFNKNYLWPWLKQWIGAL